MRIAAIALLALVLAGCTPAKPVGLFHTFDVGMTWNEVRRIFARHGGNIFEESDKHEIMFGRIPSRGPQASAMLFFRDGRLYAAVFDYDPAIRFDAPKMTDRWCDANFSRAHAEMEMAFGKSEPIASDDPETGLRIVQSKWQNSRRFATTIMTIEDKTCADLFAVLVAGSEEAFMRGIERR